MDLAAASSRALTLTDLRPPFTKSTSVVQTVLEMPTHISSRPARSLPFSLLSLSSLTTLFLALPSPATAFDCKDIVAQTVRFDLGKLAGPRSVFWEQPRDDDNNQQHKFNFTIDVCNKLSNDVGCHTGTKVCGIREDIDLDGVANSTFHPIDIAGTYASAGRQIDPKFELLRNSRSHSDVAREGLRVTLHGGKYPDTKNGTDQQAIIEFVCDKDRSGLDDEKKGDGEKDKNDDKEKEKSPGDKTEKFIRREGAQCEGGDDQSLRFCGYANEKTDKGKDVKTLRLEWRTKEACEDVQASDPGGSSWGFFTWFIIIFFLGTATYLIFGSWLNYNRYGARGWDLLPHGDTIRDIPYLLKDCARRAKDTMQGSGGRGGYSAV